MTATTAFVHTLRSACATTERGHQMRVEPPVAAEPGSSDQRLVRVVYVAGDGRSGTTLLSRILGAYDGCIAVGEVYDIWNKSIQGHTLCSCGAPFLDCDFWNAVMCEAFGNDGVSPNRLVTLRRSVQATRHIPFLLFPRLRPRSFQRRLEEYVDTTERLYRAIQTVSGCQFIVDSSKMAMYALALTESRSIDVRLVHVVRDSRACVFSWRRLKREATANGQSVYLRQRPVVMTAVIWALRNTMLRLVSRRFQTVASCRYEDIVWQPVTAVTGLVEQLGIERHNVVWTESDELHATNPHHIFAGNPVRIESGAIKFRMDDEWRTEMPRIQKGIVTALTLPLLWHMGYIGQRRQWHAVAQRQRFMRVPR